MQLPQYAKKYFWDVDVARIDEQHHEAFIIQRLFEYGNLEANAWLLRTFSRKALTAALTGKNLSDRSRHFWALILNATQHSALCTKKSLARKPHTVWNTLHR